MPLGATHWAARVDTVVFAWTWFSSRWASGVLALLCAGRAWIGVTGLKRGQRGSEVVKGRWMVHVGPPQEKKKPSAGAGVQGAAPPGFHPLVAQYTGYRLRSAQFSLRPDAVQGVASIRNAAPRSTACAAFPGAQRTSFGRSSYDSWDTSVWGRLCPRSSCFPRGTCLSQLGQERDSVP